METCPWTKWGCVTLSGRTSNLTPLSGTLRFFHLLSLCVFIVMKMFTLKTIQSQEIKAKAPLQFD